jgi:hypothetical protein
VIGYVLGTSANLIFSFATTIGGVFEAHFLDDIGKRIQCAPHDALVAKTMVESTSLLDVGAPDTVHHIQ